MSKLRMNACNQKDTLDTYNFCMNFIKSWWEYVMDYDSIILARIINICQTLKWFRYFSTEYITSLDYDKPKYPKCQFDKNLNVVQSILYLQSIIQIIILFGNSSQIIQILQFFEAFLDQTWFIKTQKYYKYIHNHQKS